MYIYLKFLKITKTILNINYFLKLSRNIPPYKKSPPAEFQHPHMIIKGPVPRNPSKINPRSTQLKGQALNLQAAAR